MVLGHFRYLVLTSEIPPFPLFQKPSLSYTILLLPAWNAGMYSTGCLPVLHPSERKTSSQTCTTLKWWLNRTCLLPSDIKATVRLKCYCKSYFLDVCQSLRKPDRPAFKAALSAFHTCPATAPETAGGRFQSTLKGRCELSCTLCMCVFSYRFQLSHLLHTRFQVCT